VNGNCLLFNDLTDLCEALCRQWCQLGEQAIRERGAFHVALAGGTTPRQFYTRLAQYSSKDTDLWQNTHCYFGDERCVPLDDAQSNYRMAYDAMLSHVPIDMDHVHPMFDPAFSAAQNAQDYAALLQSRLPLSDDRQPVFDLVLLGMGGDGHTASLFPGTEILQEKQLPVEAQYVEKLQAWRVSLTFPAINAARHVAILVVGAAKAEVLADVAKASVSPLYPIQSVRPHGCLEWYLDQAAASLLPPAVCT
jgi:6-phosphogluconolactonase